MAARYSNSVEGGSINSGDEDSAQLLADALKKMDGLIGDYRPHSPEAPVLSSDPVILEIVDHCEHLGRLISRWNQGSSASPVPLVHPRECVPTSIQEAIISWLGAISLEQSRHLVHDKDELLGQVVSLQKQLEMARGEASKLSLKVGNVEKRYVEKDQQLRETSEELRLAKVTLSTKEVELRHLQDQIQAGHRPQKGGRQVSFGNPTNAANTTTNTANTANAITFNEAHAPLHRRSFRNSIRKAFWRKGRHSATLEEAALPPPRPTNHRADAFCAKDCRGLAEWFQEIGLDMYTDLAEEKIGSGEKLVELISEGSNHPLVQVGILSTLHCKKLRLATEEAIKEHPSPLAELNHEWVSQWLLDLGLPQFQRTFGDARFDGLMLDGITMEDLRLLDVTVPFHICSIKRALQAFRMCSYDKEYLKESSPGKKHGSQKLLHWTAKDVATWLCGVELDEYVGGLDSRGIHGAVMLLDVHFSSESLARAIGVSQAKTIIRKHLSKKFMELIGPVAAQSKVDAMREQSKGYLPLDPTETPSEFSRQRSRSVNHKRGSRKNQQEEQLLPLDKFPPSSIASSPLPLVPVEVEEGGNDNFLSSDPITRYPTP